MSICNKYTAKHHQLSIVFQCYLGKNCVMIRIRLWSDKQFYYDGAVEEMGQAYAEGIKALQTPGHLTTVIVLTAAVAVLGVCLCTKVDKKSSKLLD